MKLKRTKLKKMLLWGFGILISVLVLYPLLACLVYPPEYVFRALPWGEADVHDYQKFFERSLKAGKDIFYFDEDLQEVRVRSLFESNPQIDNLDAFLSTTGTQAILVIQDDQILFEKYFNELERGSIVTSFSVAKSFTSALIGLAIEDGFIHSVNDSITTYLPELEIRDPRFRDITIRDLLMMSSGIHYSEGIPLLHDDGTKTYLYPDLRQLALNHTHISESSGVHFLYNNYNPLLLGMILERAAVTPVAHYLEREIWQPLGMEYDGSWSLDSQASGFEKMESGINARAIDFAKFGRLFLHRGNWDGLQVLPTSWVTESTQADASAVPEDYYLNLESDPRLAIQYKYFWWVLPRSGGENDFSAVGNHGQFIYISPQADLIVVRHGERYGIEWFEWLKIFYQLASDINGGIVSQS